MSSAVIANLLFIIGIIILMLTLRRWLSRSRDK